MTLKAFRNTAGLSIKGLSDKTGIPISTLYAYEKENALPSSEVALKLAAAYMIPFRDLEPLVKNAKGVTSLQLDEQAAKNFKAKFKLDTPTPQTEAPHEPTPRKEEVREPVIPETAPESVTSQVKTATDAEYIEAVSRAIKTLRAILGADNNGMIMLAVGFVTAEIENRLFIDR